MRIILLFLLFSLSSCVVMQEDNSWIVTEKSLNGAWQFQLIDEQGRSHNNGSSLSTMNVPGHWKSSGLDYAGSAIYSRQFEQKTMSPNARYWLILDAVDYSSDISVNSRFLSRQKGYFLPHRVEITPAISSGKNQIDVTVHSPDEPSGEDWSLNKTLIKGVLNHHDTRPGGAWSEHGQDWNSGGIWGDAALKQTGPILISQLVTKPSLIMNASQRPVPEKPWPTQAEVRVELNSAQITAATLSFTLTERHSGESEQWTTQQRLAIGNNNITMNLPVKDRWLWWPWDWGEPHLYDLSVQVEVEGNVSDKQTTAMGFRQIILDSNEKQFQVNGHPYFIRGTNYIASQWLGNVSLEQYKSDMALMQDANINSVRVHAHVAGKTFYNVADEAGMLIWQDFPLQWGYSDSPQFVTEAVRQAKAMTALLANHPSIVVWCGHNEPPWDARWMKYKYPTYYPERNISLTQAVHQALLDTDDGRVVREASYTHEHPWLGWYSGTYRDYATFVAPMIVSEFGAQALPNWPMTQSLAGTSEWPLGKAVLDRLVYHNYQPHETTNIAHVQQGESLSRFWINSQEYQRVVTKFAAEHLRLKKGKGLAAIYQFMFVDSWPAITWSVLDVERKAKPAYTALSIAYQPVLPIAVFDPGNPIPELTVVVVNDTLQRWHNVSLVVRNRYGEKQWQFDGLTIEPNQTRTLLESKALFGLSTAMELQLLDSQGEVIAVNRYRAPDF